MDRGCCTLLAYMLAAAQVQSLQRRARNFWCPPSTDKPNHSNISNFTAAVMNRHGLCRQQGVSGIPKMCCATLPELPTHAAEMPDKAQLLVIACAHPLCCAHPCVGGCWCLLAAMPHIRQTRMTCRSQLRHPLLSLRLYVRAHAWRLWLQALPAAMAHHLPADVRPMPLLQVFLDAHKCSLHVAAQACAGAAVCQEKCHASAPNLVAAQACAGAADC